MWLRGEPPATAAVYQASAASIAQCLGVHLEVSNKDGKVFMESLNARPTRLQLGAVSYGMDFLDPANLLGGKEDEIFPKLLEAGALLVADGADVICLGSTTMHESHGYLSERLPVPVINPGPLTYKLAETVLGLGLSHSRKAYAPPTYPRPGLAVAMMDGAAKWVPED